MTRVSSRHRDVLSSIADSAAIEACFAECLDLEADAISYLDDEVGPHPASYPATPLGDDQLFRRWFELPIDQLIDEVIRERGGSRTVATMTFVADRRLEVLSHAFRRHPQIIEDARERLGLLPPGEPKQTGDDVFSYLVGVAFGRWDVRIGRDRSRAPNAGDPFDPVLLCPPGMLVGDDGYPATVAPAGYPLELPLGRPLVDEPGHRWDIEAAVGNAAKALFDGSDDVLADLLGVLGRRSIREHLRRQFFRDHLGRYSRSRRRAPIYWPLTVPSRTWGVWVYAPMLSRETLYAVASEAGRRLRLAGEAIARLQQEQWTGGAGRSARTVAEALDVEERLAEELRIFTAQAERIAGLGWNPDLDDGLILCAAPLADIFPAWPDAARARQELKEGKYAWATAARWADQL